LRRLQSGQEQGGIGAGDQAAENQHTQLQQYGREVEVIPQISPRKFIQHGQHAPRQRRRAQHGKGCSRQRLPKKLEAEVTSACPNSLAQTHLTGPAR